MPRRAGQPLIRCTAVRWRPISLIATAVLTWSATIELIRASTICAADVLTFVSPR